MKTVKNKDLEWLALSLKEAWRIEAKMLETNDKLTNEEIVFLKERPFRFPEA